MNHMNRYRNVQVSPLYPAKNSLYLKDFNLWNDGHCSQCQPQLNTANNSIWVPFPPSGVSSCCPPTGGVCGGDYPQGPADTCPSSGTGTYITYTSGLSFNGIFKAAKLSQNCSDINNLCGEMNVALSYWNDPCNPLEYGFLTWFGNTHGYIAAYLQGRNPDGSNWWKDMKVQDYDGNEHEYKALVWSTDPHTIYYYIDNNYILSITNPNNSYLNIKMKYIFSVHRWDCSYSSTNWGLNIRDPAYYVNV